MRDSPFEFTDEIKKEILNIVWRYYGDGIVEVQYDNRELKSIVFYTDEKTVNVIDFIEYALYVDKENEGTDEYIIDDASIKEDYFIIKTPLINIIYGDKVDH